MWVLIGLNGRKNQEVREQSWERPFLLVVTVDGDAFAFASEHARNAFTAVKKRGESWITSAEFYGETPDYAKFGWILPQWPQMVAETLGKKGLRKGRIGVDVMSGPLKRAADLLPSVELPRRRWFAQPALGEAS